MVLKVILVAVIIIAFIGIIGNFAPQASLNGALQNLQTSAVTLVYAGEFDEIRNAVNDFIRLRTIRGTSDAEVFADKLDQRLNNLQLVKMYCSQKISTLDLANEKNPYIKLQEICPSLKDISFSKAAQLFRLI